MSDSNLSHSDRKTEPELDELIKHLKIREDEDQGIVLEENLEDLKAGARWTILAKVLSPNPFSHAAFLANMKYAWSLAKDVTFKAIDENLFVFQFSCLRDWRKVLDDGPWFFRGNAVLLEEYDGITKPSTVKFRNLNIWVRVYDVPTGFRTKNIGRQIGDKIGQFLMVDLDDETGGWRDYLRIRIKLDIEKPLTRIVYVLMGEKGNRVPFRIKYEKLPKFCAVCGLLGHVVSECGDGVHDKAAYQYGDWLIASPERKGRIKGSRPTTLADTSRLDSKELGMILVPKRSNETKSGDSNQNDSVGDNPELKDDARISLEKGYVQFTKSDGNGARKCISIGDEKGHNKLVLATVSGAEQMEYILNNSGTSGDFVPAYDHQNELEKDEQMKGRGLKRQRKENEEDEVDDIEMKAVGSLEEYRREQ